MKKLFGPLLFAILTVAAGVGIAVGLMRHDEPGLLMICDESSLTVRYSPPARCTKTIELTWRAMPLHLSPSSNAVRSAIDDINLQLGFRAFKTGGDDVTIETGIAHEAGWFDATATTYHERINGRLKAHVRIGNVGDIATLHAVLVHELGHVLGLTHDKSPDSIMYSPARNDRMVRFTDSDVALLRHLYQ